MGTASLQKDGEKKTPFAVSAAKGVLLIADYFEGIIF